MFGLAPVAHQAWHNIYLVSDCGDINHCLVKVASVARKILITGTEQSAKAGPSLALTSCQHVYWITPIIQGAFRLGVWGLYVSELLSHWGTNLTGTFALSHPSGVEMFSYCISHSQQKWPVQLYLSCSYVQKAQRPGASIHQSFVAVSPPVLQGWQCRAIYTRPLLILQDEGSPRDMCSHQVTLLGLWATALPMAFPACQAVNRLFVVRWDFTSGCS